MTFQRAPATVSNSYTFTINPGQTGYVTFAPRYVHSEGNIAEYQQDSLGHLYYLDTVFGSCETPQRLSNGLMDGYVTAAIS